MGARDQIYRQIMSRGWHERRRAFVQHYDTNVLDASILLHCPQSSHYPRQMIPALGCRRLDAISHELPFSD